MYTGARPMDMMHTFCKPRIPARGRPLGFLVATELGVKAGGEESEGVRLNLLPLLNSIPASGRQFY